MRFTRLLIVAGATLVLASLYIVLAPRAEAKKIPANGRIAFTTKRDGNFEIYAMSPDGTNPVRLTNNSAVDANPGWSPDGKKIAFDSTRDGNAEIYIMNLNGSNQTRLTTVAGTDADPQISPDGTKIVFHSQRDGNFEIYVMNADGSGQTRLTNAAGNDLHASWSPDGAKIIFDSLRDGNAEIYIMNANGSGQTRLTNNPTSDQAASISLDGTKITFQRHVDNHAQIFVMNTDGTNPVALTTTGENFAPAFSPDGLQIAFARSANNDEDIFVMDVDGSSVVQLTSTAGDDIAPHWQPIPRTDTIGTYRPSTSQFLIRNSNSTGAPDATVAFGQVGDKPVAGDWNGDGITTQGVFRNGQFLLRQPTTIKILGQPRIVIFTLTINFGQAGDLPVVGDWNGDGIDTVGVFRPSTSTWLLTNSPNISSSSPAVDLTSFFGISGDLPIAGDWNGDGIDTIGVFRPTGNTFFLSNSNTSGSVDISFAFGIAEDLPLAGDWNGDGIDTVGILRPSVTTFFLSNVNALDPASIFSFNFGASGDRPLAGDWDGLPQPPNSGVNDPDAGSSSAGETQIFTTTCSDPEGWHNISTIDFKIAKSDGAGNGVAMPLWAQFDEDHNLVRLYNPDLDTWTEGPPGANIVLSNGYVSLDLSGTTVEGSGPNGISVKVTWKVVFTNPAIKNNYKQYLKITDDTGLTTGFDKIGSWSVAR